MTEVIPKILYACKQYRRYYLKANKRGLYNLKKQRRLYDVVKKFIQKHEEYQKEYQDFY